MDSNSTVVYINDEQFSKLLDSINSKDVQSEVVQDAAEPVPSNSSDGLSVIDVLSFILLAEFIIIGILAWFLVMRK